MDGRWSRFDMCATLGFTGKKERTERLEREIDRVGIADRLQIWQFPTPFDGWMMERLRLAPGMDRTGYFSSTMGHYRAVKTALELGAESVLVMEDDVRFVKDLAVLDRGIDELPSDYDVALFDVFKMDNDRIELLKESCAVGRVDVTCWCRPVAWEQGPRSLACYALSRRGMEWFARRLERCVTVKNARAMISDHHLTSRFVDECGINLYFANPNLAIQAAIGPSNSRQNVICGFEGFYKSIGVDVKDYAEA